MCGLSTREYRGRNHIDVKEFAMPIPLSISRSSALRRYYAGPV